MITLNINSDASVKFTKTLENMRKSALPNAVRSSLNSAAFDVKKDTMPKKAATTFRKRHNGQFFKANSRVEMASGWKVENMKSTVGFLSQNKGNTKLKGKHNYSIQDLEEQEYGGNIEHRDLRPLDKARSSSNRPVRPKNRIELIKQQTGGISNIIDASIGNSMSPKQRFIRAAYMAKKTGGGDAYILGNKTTRRKQTLFRIESIVKGAKGIRIKSTPLYTFKLNNDWSVKGTGFMRYASTQSGNKLDQFYIDAAKKQIARLK